MHLHSHLSLERARRRDRGFSLLELGIVMAVAVVLMAGVTASIQGLTRHARVTRTVDEMPRVLAAGQSAVARVMWVNYNTTPPTYILGTPPGGTSIPPNTPVGTAMLPVNLHTIPVSDPLYQSLKEVLGGGAGSGGNDLANDGLNPYGDPKWPYWLYLNSARIEVRTCVDGLDFEDSSAFKALAPCQDVVPDCVDTHDSPKKCVSLSGPLVNVGSQRTRYSYDPSLFAP